VTNAIANAVGQKRQLQTKQVIVALLAVGLEQKKSRIVMYIAE
jgi:hypothetical protein